MSISTHIRQSLEMPMFVVKSYLEDLEEAELLVCPGEKMNCIAWQLGHLIRSEHGHISALNMGQMPQLPAGFADRYVRRTANGQERTDFHDKATYLRLMDEQRGGTLAILAELSDQQLMQAAPEAMRYFGPTVGCVFAGEASHWMMHAGQWAVVRRQLGRPPLF